MREVMTVIKALADENRVRIVMFLHSGELCVCQIVEMLGLAPSTVSKHLDILFHAGLIDARKESRWVYYRIDGNPSLCAKEAMAWLGRSLGDDPQVVADIKRLKRVCKIDKEKLCCRYKKRGR
jgi:ArsR family transcriptional regulator, arsenate/arsenite/antimonite-responsive transcriptional repressor